eukprot:764449-Hanusia_phi.AAC.9
MNIFQIPFVLYVQSGNLNAQRCTAIQIPSSGMSKYEFGINDTEAWGFASLDGKRVTILVIGRDQYGNVVDIPWLNFNVTAPAAEDCASHYDGKGYFLFEFTPISRHKGNYTSYIYIQYVDENIMNSPFELTVRSSAGNIDSTRSFWFGDSLHYISSGTATKFFVQTVDKNGIFLSNGGQNLLATIQTPSNIAIHSLKDLQDGLYEVEIFLTISANYSIAILFQDQIIQNKKIYIEVLPGPLNTEASIAIVSPDQIDANSSFALIIHPKDQYGNAITLDSVQDKGSFLGFLKGEHEIRIASFEINGPEVRSNLTMTIAGKYQIWIYFDQRAFSFQNRSLSLTVAPLKLSTYHSHVYAKQNIVAGEFLQLKIVGKDVYGNPSTKVQGNITVSIDQTQIPIDSFSTDQNLIVFERIFTVSGNYSLEMSIVEPETIVQFFDSKFFLIVNPSYALIENSILAGPDKCLITAECVVTLESYDMFQNPCSEGGMSFMARLNTENVNFGYVHDNGNGKYNCTFMNIDIGEYIFTVEFNGVAVDNLTKHISVVPGPANFMSTLPNDIKYGAIAGSPTTSSFKMRDALNNPTNYYDGDLELLIDDTKYNYTSVIVHDILEIYFNITRSGIFQIDIQLAQKQLWGCPFNLTVNPGDIALDSISLQGPGMTLATAGQISSFVLKLRDVFGNYWVTDAEFPPALNVLIVSDNYNLTQASFSQKANSSWHLTYVMTKSSCYSIVVRTYNTNFVKSYQDILQVLPDTFSLKHTSVKLINQFVTAGNMIEFNVTINDQFSNPISGEHNYSIKLHETCNSFKVPRFSLLFVSEGHYMLSTYATKAGINCFVVALDQQWIHQPFEVTILPATAADNNSSIVYDVFGNWILLQNSQMPTVTVQEAGSRNTLQLETKPYDEKYAGFAAFVVISTSGNYLVDVELIKAHIGGSPFSIAVVDKSNDVLSVEQSFLWERSVTIATAGVTSTFTIQPVTEAGVQGLPMEDITWNFSSPRPPRDVYSNPSPSFSPGNFLRVNILGDSGTIFARSLYTSENNFNITYNITKKGKYVILFDWTSNDSLTSTTITKNLEVFPGKVSKGKSIVYGAGLSSAVAGTVSEFRVLLYDNFGNFKDPQYLSISRESPYEIQVQSSRPFAPNCVVEGLGIHFAIAGLETGFSIFPRDEFGNSVVYNNYTFYGYKHQNSVLTRLLCNKSSHETYGCTYLSTISSKLSLSIFFEEYQVKSSPFQLFVRPGRFSNRQSHVKGSSEATAEGGRLISDAEDFKNGTYQLQLFTTKSGKLAIWIQHLGKNVFGSPYVVTVLPADICISCTGFQFSTLRSCYDSKTYCGEVKENIRLDVLAKDIYRNDVTTFNFLQIEIRNNKSASLIPYQSDINNQLRLYFSGVVSGSYQLQLAVDTNSSIFIRILLFPLTLSEGGYVASSDPNSTVEAGQIYPLLYELLEDHQIASAQHYSAKFNECNWLLDFSFTKSGVKNLRVLLTDYNAFKMVYVFSVEPGSLVAANSKIFGPGADTAINRRTTTIFVVLLDQFNNMVGAIHPLDRIEANYISDTNNYLIALKYNTKGVLEGTYTPGKTETNATLTVKIDGVNIKDSPRSIRVYIANSPFPSYRFSFAFGESLSLSVAGMQSKFTIQSVDKYGIYFTRSALNFTAAVALQDYFSELELSDNFDGSFSVQYVLTRAGKYRISVILDNNHIYGSPFTINVVPSSVNLSTLVYGGDTVTIATAGVPSKFFLIPRDTYGNQVSTSPEVEIT